MRDLLCDVRQHKTHTHTHTHTKILSIYHVKIESIQSNDTAIVLHTAILTVTLYDVISYMYFESRLQQTYYLSLLTKSSVPHY